MSGRTLKALSTCALFLSVLAVCATPAHAEKESSWLILTSGGILKTGAELSASVEGEIESKTASLLSKVFGVSFQLLCTAATLVGVKLEKEGSLTNGGKIKLTGCSVTLNGEAAPECEVHSTGQPVGTLETNAVKGLLVSVGSEARVLVEPKTGESFVTTNMGPECAIGENISIFGVLYLKDCENLISTHLVKHLFEADSVNSNMWIINNTAEHKVTIDGSVFTFLGGAHTALKWAGEPGGESAEEEEKKLEEEKLAELPRWLVLDKSGTALDASKLPAAMGASIAGETLSLSSTISGSEVEVKCAAMTLVGVKVSEKGKLAASAKARFTGCGFWIAGKEAFECEVHSKGSSVGTIETDALKGEIVKVSEEAMVKVEPESGETLAGLRLGEFCPLGEEVPVKGVLYVKESGETASEHLVNHEFEVGSSTSLTALGNAAKASGKGIAFLTGEHLNSQWSAEA